MWVLVPQAVAGKLLGALRKPLSSLWASLAPLLLWLRATLWLAAADPAQRQPAGGEPRGTGEEEEEDGSGDGPLTPTSVNYHFTRQCNYKCGFCFHTAKTSFVLPLDEAKRGLRLLKDAGMEKINFSGGEPFLQDRGQYLGELVRFCKRDLGLPSVSVVSNGSLVRERWFASYGQYLDILAISCDSFNEDVNVLIGRGQGKINHVENLHKLRRWCRDYRVAFKVNSVINRFNVDEDMREHIKELSPVRWKVFQCLIIEGENSGDGALREAERFVISKEEFQEFLDRHKEVSCLVPECNDKMKDSYLILDEYMRFLNCRKGRKDPSKSILDVGVDEAIKFSGFDEKAFLTRGGKYVWSKADLKLDW
ncbi:radical S-adenosyl methionine domain-containing protein 2 isoform X1 [Molossus molossus]|uniref:S-adenosylmethionine-dependent nucleotide dehydratase RSAD2 n=1 Tax=Molossus molossus TaxID=27622 RepID=A0A7J8E4G8_MOLMO|nr:radical S-adenosyl methionine domain-containing protein 2 isoform X1 [Molossus molossus]KAF6430221.1 radical S-adenosyl methionine domain containing 2 [Molossus molossus]